MEICDVPQRISPDEKNVGAHAGLERANLFFLTEMPRSNGGSCLERRLLGQPRLDQSLDLVDGCQSRRLWPDHIRANHNADTRLVKLCDGLQFGLLQGFRESRRRHASERRHQRSFRVLEGLRDSIGGGRPKGAVLNTRDPGCEHL